MAHYINPQPVPFADDCILYTRSDTDGAVYYCRIKTNVGTQKYIVRSLKTNDLSIATNKAKTLYMQLRISEERGIPFNAPRFREAIQPFIYSLSCSPKRKRYLFNYLTTFSDYAGPIRIEDITADLYFSTMRHWSDKNDGLSHNTIRGQRSTMTQFLRWAKSANLITSVPPLNISPSAKGIIITGERLYSKGVSDAWLGVWNAQFHRRWLKKKHRSIRTKYAVERLDAMMKFCRHTYTRPTTEVTSIQFKHLVPKRDRSGFKYYWVTIPQSKTSRPGLPKARHTVLPSEFARHFDAWVEKAKGYGIYDPDNYVFPNYLSYSDREAGLRPGRTKMKKVSALFRKIMIDISSVKTRKYPNGYNLLEQDGLAVSFMGATRHTSLTHALIERRIPVAELARLAGTSISMLERIYLSAINEASSIKHASAYRHVDEDHFFSSQKIKFEQNDGIVVTPGGPRNEEPEAHPPSVDPDPQDAWEEFLEANYGS